MAGEQRKEEMYDALLNGYISRKEYIKVNRFVTNGEANIAGFILKMSADFILLQKCSDFDFDGYAIVRKDHFDSIRCTTFDKTQKKILKAEGLIEKYWGIENDIDLNNWQTIFTCLRKYDYHVIIECEDLDEPTFNIGPISRVYKKHVSTRYYDADGLLDKKLTRIEYADITVVEFGDRYTSIFRKYVKEPKKG